MERDFLGTIGRKEETGSKPEPDYLGGGGGGSSATAAMQWQIPARVGAAASSAFMSFRPAATAVAREDSKGAVFDRFSLSGFRPPPQPSTAGDAFDAAAAMKQSGGVPPLSLQRQFGFDGHVGRQQQYAAAAAAAAQGVDSFGVAAVAAHHFPSPAPTPRHAVPFSQANPMLRVQSLPNVAGGSPYKNQPFAVGNSAAGSTVGVYGGVRDLQNLKPTQMTIFYDGLVNVFENVPVEKAQELMLLASRASILSPPSVARKSDSPISATGKITVPEVLPARQIIVQKPEASLPHISGVSTPIAVVPQAMTLSKSSSSSNNDSAVPRSAGPPLAVTPLNQASQSQPLPLASTNASPIMPRAVPQARKASLARFLEKRKERVSSVVPYPSSKSPLESSDTMGSPSTPSKSSCTNITPSTNNCEESLCLGHPRNISFSSQEAPSTKLQI